MSSTPKQVGLSFLYLISVIIYLILVDIAFFYFANYVLLKLMNWFNELPLLWQIFIAIFLSGLFVSLLSLYATLNRLLGYFIFRYFPINNFTGIVSVILPLANAGWLIYGLITAQNSWNFWKVLEIIWLAILILFISFAVVQKKEMVAIEN
jgi:hypothetical protein